MILNPAWERHNWMLHGFGTNASGNWTHRPERAWVNQIHSARVIAVTRPGAAGDGDALITDRPGVLLEVRTADCLPILVLDPTKRAIAAIHAGWRGTADGIVPALLSELSSRYGTHQEEVEVSIGPGIGACCFEVGPEVAGRFGLGGRVKVDLKAEVTRQFVEAGIRPENIHAVGICTMCENGLFHSFRRDGAQAGRMASGIELRM